MLGLGANPRHLDLRPLAHAGDVLVDALPERGSLVGRLGPNGLDPRGSLGLEAGRRLGAARDGRLAHGLDQARDEGVLTPAALLAIGGSGLADGPRGEPLLCGARYGGLRGLGRLVGAVHGGPCPVGPPLDAVLHGIGIDHLGLGIVVGHSGRSRCGVRRHGWRGHGAAERPVAKIVAHRGRGGVERPLVQGRSGGRLFRAALLLGGPWEAKTTLLLT
jgi:hypothetical protein